MIIPLKGNKIEKVGNKAAGLNRLIALGLTVPQAWAVQWNYSVTDEDIQSLPEDKLYAVRSSSDLEDSNQNSAAGIFDSYLGIKHSELLKYIQLVRESKNSEKCKHYCLAKGIPHKNVNVGVVIQEMVPSEKSGIAFTKHPLTKEEHLAYIEAVEGLGELAVSGEVVTDKYVFDNNSKKIEKTVGVQHKRMILTPQGAKNEFIYSRMQKLTDDEILQLANTVQEISEKFSQHCDIEWAFHNGKLFILQSRPITD